MTKTNNTPLAIMQRQQTNLKMRNNIELVLQEINKKDRQREYQININMIKTTQERNLYNKRGKRRAM